MKKVYLLVLVFASVLISSCGSNSDDVENAELTHAFQVQANDKDTVGSTGNGNGGGGSQDEGSGPDGW